MDKIDLRAIMDLEGMTFFIPSYQRGYRWDERQVEDLLNDIKEFNEEESGFYCVQPLVVAKKDDDILRRIKDAADIPTVERILKGSWAVIDGQQRLTTIYIILKCLGNHDFYTINYETKKELDLKSLDQTNMIDKDIDYAHMHKAYTTATKWFEDMNVVDKEKYRTKLLNNVKFIWYESVNENAINVFTRLNIGKISLTNSELIKALLFNSYNFEKERNNNPIKPQEIAAEWDHIENSLQNDSFWLFIHEKEYNQPTRIDYIFDMVCAHDALGCKSEDKNDNDQYKTFRYFYKYFSEDRNKDHITKCWAVVKSYFQILQEWYNDVTMFHYIGFLAAVNNNSSKLVLKLVAQWKNCKSKAVFLKHLKASIKEIINNCPALDAKYKEDGSDKAKCKSILLFHNIQTAINLNEQKSDKDDYQMVAFYKFPFHLYKSEAWDVEHINSNTSNMLEDEKSRYEWLSNIYLSAETEDQNLILSYFESDKEIGEKNEIFKQLMERYKDKEEWSQQEKNMIWNYTLLDSSTNRSYGNAIFSGKRRIIIGKDCGKNIPIPQLKRQDNNYVLDNVLDKSGVETEAESPFVPPCTKRVFLKYYSASYSENNYWTKNDAEQYKQDIQKCINKL